MKVTITESCDRCKRTIAKEVDSSEIEALEQAAEARVAKRQELLQLLETFENAPDLVVLFKGKVTFIDRVCDAYCASTVQNNLDVAMKTVDPSKRKPRKPKTASEDAPAPEAKKSGKSEVKDKSSQKAASK